MLQQLAHRGLRSATETLNAQAIVFLTICTGNSCWPLAVTMTRDVICRLKERHTTLSWNQHRKRSRHLSGQQNTNLISQVVDYIPHKALSRTHRWRIDALLWSLWAYIRRKIFRNWTSLENFESILHSCVTTWAPSMSPDVEIERFILKSNQTNDKSTKVNKRHQFLNIRSSNFFNIVTLRGCSGLV